MGGKFVATAIVTVILLGIVGIAFADMDKFVGDENEFHEYNEANIIPIDSNTIPEINTPIKEYEPVSEENHYEANEMYEEMNETKEMVEHNATEYNEMGEEIQEMNKTANEYENTAKEKYENEENKTMEYTGEGKEKAEKMAEEQKEEVEYKKSDEVKIVVPLMAEHHVEIEEEHNGMKIECKDGVCEVTLPKKDVNRIELAKMVLEQAVKRVNAKVQVIQTAVIEKNGFAVAKAVVKEENKIQVTYATADTGSFAVIVDIPKEELNDIRKIEGNVIFLKTDPVLKIYLKSEGNTLNVAGYTVEKAEPIKTKDSIEFAVCSVRISDVKTQEVGEKEQINFKVYDGTTPVYVPNIKIVGPGYSVMPQYDEVSKSYTAVVPSASEVKIVANVSGCGEITYYVPKEGTAKNYTAIVVAAVLLAVVAAGWYLWKA